VEGDQAGEVGLAAPRAALEAPVPLVAGELPPAVDISQEAEGLLPEMGVPREQGGLLPAEADQPAEAEQAGRNSSAISIFLQGLLNGFHPL
jgi:hypothetical protein